MARSKIIVTEAPKGMHKFIVTGATIKDSVGNFCAKGDMAILDKETATSYLEKNMIKVELPDFEDEDGESGKDKKGSDDDKSNASSETKTTASENSGKDTKKPAAKPAGG